MPTALVVIRNAIQAVCQKKENIVIIYVGHVGLLPTRLAYQRILKVLWEFKVKHSVVSKV